MKPIVSIMAQGSMGAATAARLVENGVVVRTVVAGRSAASAERAKTAGMTAGLGRRVGAGGLPPVDRAAGGSDPAGEASCAAPHIRSAKSRSMSI